jgi:GTP-binding protein LepA
MDKIRNFVIIAHIDHGKSTLADRFLEMTHTVPMRKMREQLLDQMDLERERGITIKLQPVRMAYQYNGGEYILNLIDTPGHVDFSYEVSRSLAAVEGAILLVDATQGVQAQTLAHLELALRQGLAIIPAINKIDLAGADVESVKTELARLMKIDKKEILEISGKTGAGVEKLLNKVINKVPSPGGETNKPLRALIFDSVFDKYKGVVAYVRIVDGEVKTGEPIKIMASGKMAEALEVGIFTPQLKAVETLATGEIGYIATGLRNASQVRVGDTITMSQAENVLALPGYRRVTPFVYAGVFTIDNNDYPKLRDALEKLVLSDSSLVYEPESSPALGFGFRCGFLGLLHLEIVKERLEREFNLNLITTTPSVSYEIISTKGEKTIISNPTELPEAGKLKSIAEPWVSLGIITPSAYLGTIIQLLQGKRGLQKNIEHLDPRRVLLTYEMPLSNIMVDFYDRLKSVSSGYASMSYEFLEYRIGNLVKIDLMVNGKIVDALSVIVDKSVAHKNAREITAKLKEVIPRQNFRIVIQAAINGKIIAREEIPPFRKDVLAKLYGGDRTRKDKLLKKQKKGKKRMKQVGQVEIPQEAFLKLLA